MQKTAILGQGMKPSIRECWLATLETRILRLDGILERVWKRQGHSLRFERLLTYQETLLR